MKKSSIILLIAAILLLVSILVFTACGEAPGTTVAGDTTEAPGTTTEAPTTTEPIRYSEGLAYRLNDDGTGFILKGRGECADADIMIPPTYRDLPVIAIGEYAFSESKYLKSITIPDSVTSIEYYAFSGCTGLTSITIPDSVTYIGFSALEGCTKLATLTLPSLETVEEGDYSRSPLGLLFGSSGIFENDKYVPKSLKTVVVTGDKDLGINAFSCCPNITSITLSGNVKKIGHAAFSYCTGLTEFTIPDSVTSLGEGVFLGCTGFTSITIPARVKTIGDYAFSDCSGLTSITVNENNKAYHSAGDCLIETASKTLLWGSKDGRIPTDGSVTSIGDYAFSDCTGLTSITIPDSVTSIGDYAFSDCTGLTSITIPDSVTSIGQYAFICCTGLTEFTIPDSVTSLGEGVFFGCTGLTSITFTGTKSEWGAIDKDYNWKRNAFINQVICQDGTLTGNEIG